MVMATNPGERAPLLMIGLDAAEWTLVERWMADGSMPELRALCERGSAMRLGSTANWLVGSPWPSFYTGTTPADHGLYHYLLWRPEQMASDRPATDWLPLQPFWRHLGERTRVVAVDVPLTYPPGSFNGVEISGWGTHEVLQQPTSWPPELMSQVRRRFGSPPLGTEQARLFSAAELLAIRDQCLQSVQLSSDLVVDLMREQHWHLLLWCLAATHRGGHQLWSDDNLRGDPTAGERRELEGALKSIYMACDAAVGRAVRAAGSAATVLVFALHGMGPNVSRADLLGQMIQRVLAGAAATDSASLLQRARRLVPAAWRSTLKSWLPYELQDRLTQFWRTGGLDWDTTRAFPLLCDLDGYVRINLRGREAAGIVEPGAEYEELCAALADGFRSFVDADTGRPVVDAIARPDDLYADGARRAALPDLMLRWSDTPAARHRVVHSPRHGDIRWPVPGRHPQGRSGNHRPDGFLIAAGAALGHACAMPEPHILDLAPTALHLLGHEQPSQMRGRPLFAGRATPR